MSRIFTAGIQTTSRVEGYNNIIKRELTSNGTLCNLASALDARLESEVKWNRFFEYHTLSTCMGIASVGHDLFPKVDKLMSEYLTPHILSTERSEIAQSLYFIASKVELDIIEVIEVNFLCQKLLTLFLNNFANTFAIQDPGVGITDGCIEDQYNAKQTLLKSMIAEVGEERVCELWKITDMQPENKKYIHYVIIINTILYSISICVYLTYSATLFITIIFE